MKTKQSRASAETTIDWNYEDLPNQLGRNELVLVLRVNGEVTFRVFGRGGLTDAQMDALDALLTTETKLAAARWAARRVAEGGADSIGIDPFTAMRFESRVRSAGSGGTLSLPASEMPSVTAPARRTVGPRSF